MNRNKKQKSLPFSVPSPKDTQKILKNIFNDDKNDLVKNAALIFSKFVPDNLKNKGKHLRKVQKEFSNMLQKDGTFRHLNERIKKIVEDLKTLGYDYQKIEMKTSWRLVVGLGATHPEETSMIFHHIYGIPYIPASTIKGAVKHHIAQKISQNILKEFPERSYMEILSSITKFLDKGELVLNDDRIDVNNIKKDFDDAVKIFGTQSQKGNVIFLDAYPIDNVKLEIDIINPHYPDYYSKEKVPGDWQLPNPISFLTIGKNVKFRFYILSRDQRLLKISKNWLESVLKSHGIGAKTSLGYGFFEI